MKTIETTSDRLVFEQRPVALSIALVLATVLALVLAVILFRRGNDAGVILLVFALSPPVFAYFFLETRRIVFDRTVGTVRVSYRAPRGTRRDERTLTGALRVVAQRPGPTPEAREVPPEGAPGVPTRAVMLYDDDTEMPLAESYSKGPEAFQVMQAANAWLSAETA